MTTKDTISGVLLVFGVVAVVVLAAVFGVWLYQEFQGDLLSRDFQNVKHSQAYVESTNSAMRTLIVDYARSETEYLKYSQSDPTTARSYHGQMSATLNQLYALAGTLSPSEVATDVQNFMTTHPQFK